MLLSVLQTAAPYLALGACVLSLIALGLQLHIYHRLNKLTLGKTGSLEETIGMLSKDMQAMQVFRSELEKYLKHAENRLRGSLAGVGLVRFNPFAGRGAGGDQSFAAAFLDERHNGVVLSSLYARDRVAVYGKPIERGASSYELTEEEKEAIEQAKKSILERTQ